VPTLRLNALAAGRRIHPDQAGRPVHDDDVVVRGERHADGLVLGRQQPTPAAMTVFAPVTGSVTLMLAVVPTPGCRPA
jgi:hypothetical protein